MKKLNEKEWSVKEIKKIFKCYHSAAYHSENLNLIKGDGVPYITRTGKNNGLFGIASKLGSYNINPSNTISFGAETAEFFYQPFKFITGNKMYYLTNDTLNRNLGLFFIAMLRKGIKDCFSYANGAIPERVMRKSIILPINSNSDPNYQYMEKYIKSHRQRMLNIYKHYALDRVSELKYKKIKDISEKEWQPIVLSTMGQIESGKDIYSNERLNGDIPYITSGSKNNAIGYFVSNNNKTLDSGYISFNRNGSIGLAFYHEYLSLLGNDCRKIHINKADNNKYVGSFIALAITMQKESFSYGRKLGTARANKMRVMLPVDEAGEPDYEYMEQYAKNMMLKKYKQYLDYLKNKA